MYLILNNIRSAENVGSMFRTADAFGVEKIYLVGVTPGPLDRFGRAVAKVAKAALGAERTISYEHVSSFTGLTQQLKGEGARIIALEQSPRSIALSPGLVQGKVALVVGREVEGISEEDLALCDYVVEIPMRGTKESLNVAVAAGIALYALSTPPHQQ